MNLRTLSVTEASKETGMTPDAIRRLLHSGAVAGNQLGRTWRVSAASLEAWVNRKPEPRTVQAPDTFHPDNPFV